MNLYRLSRNGKEYLVEASAWHSTVRYLFGNDKLKEGEEITIRIKLEAKDTTLKEYQAKAKGGER